MQQKKVNKDKSIAYMNNRKAVRITIVLYVLIHMAFFMSGYLPDNNKYSASEFRKPQNLSQYKTISLIRWDYAPKEKVMEVTFDLQNQEYSEGRIEYEVVLDNSKNLSSDIVYSKGNMIILQITHIPAATGKKISVRFTYTDEEGKETTASFYSYTGIVNEVESLPVLSEKDYYIQRQDYDIAYYESLIKKKQNEIAENEEKISNITSEIERLRNDTSELTSDEILNLQETISNDQSSIETLQSKNEELKKNIITYQETIEILKKRKNAYE